MLLWASPNCNRAGGRTPNPKPCLGRPSKVAEASMPADSTATRPPWRREGTDGKTTVPWDCWG